MQRLGKLRGGEPSSQRRAGSRRGCNGHCRCRCPNAQKKNSTKGKLSNKLDSKRGSTIARLVVNDLYY